MTRIFIITASFLLMILFNTNALSVNHSPVNVKVIKGSFASEKSLNNQLHTHNNALPVKQDCAIPIREENHHPKTPALDETPHIHHFHKERVKKITKHHNKFWKLSQFILILCHISLLVIGYLHIIH